VDGGILIFPDVGRSTMPSFDLEACSVVGCENPLPSEVHAAEELVTWIGRIVGREPKRTAKPNGMSIILRADPTLGKEDFSIVWEGGNLVIAGGRPRGVMYGAYEFLDRFAGIRWVAADETVVPKLKSVSVPEKGFTYSPPLSYREPYFTEAFDGDWAARNRMNSNNAKLTDLHGGKISYVGFVHTFNSLVPPEEYFSSHPEYFSEVDGKRIRERTQLCLTNPDVVDIAAERAISWLRENPQASIVSVSQNDWGNPCQCRRCSKIDEDEGTHAGSLLNFVNQVAERVEEEFPDKWVDTLAYQYTRKAPKTIRPRRNVIVRLCSIECCFSHPLETCPENASFKRDTEEWAKIAHTLYVWDYVTNFRHYVMPFPNLRVLQPNVKFFLRNNVRGIFEEGSYPPGGGGEFGALRSYLLAKVLWDPNCDLDGALTEFLNGYYGGAAVPMRTYIDRLHDRVEKGAHVRIFDNPDRFLDAGFVSDSLKIFDEAESEAGDERFKRRVRLARLPLEYSKIWLMDKGEDRRKMFLDFIERCRSMGITQIREGRTLEDSIKEFESQ